MIRRISVNDLNVRLIALQKRGGGWVVISSFLARGLLLIGEMAAPTPLLHRIESLP